MYEFLQQKRPQWAFTVFSQVIFWPAITPYSNQEFDKGKNPSLCCKQAD